MLNLTGKGTKIEVALSGPRPQEDSHSAALERVVSGAWVQNYTTQNAVGSQD